MTGCPDSVVKPGDDFTRSLPPPSWDYSAIRSACTIVVIDGLDPAIQGHERSQVMLAPPIEPWMTGPVRFVLSG